MPSTNSARDPSRTEIHLSEDHVYSASVQWSASDKEYVATSPEFPGLSALAPNAAKAVRDLSGAIEVAVAAIRQDGEPLPHPRLLASHSGQFRVRVPKSLHDALARVAERDGVSLNSFVTAALARAIGVRDGEATAPKKSAIYLTGSKRGTRSARVAEGRRGGTSRRDVAEGRR